MRIHPDDRLDHFTDRADEKAAYELLWAPRARHRVLCFGGLSGIGKSTLLDYLQERHQPRRQAVKINFADPRLQVGYLFVTNLAAELRWLFPRLRWGPYQAAERSADLAGARLRALNPEINVRQVQRGAITGSPQSVLIDSEALTAELNRRVDEHDRQSRGQLLAELCTVLADGEEPFVVLVDTYEVVAHAADTEFRDWFSHEFVTTLVRMVPRSRLVLAGREGFPIGLPRDTVERWDRQDSRFSGQPRPHRPGPDPGHLPALPGPPADHRPRGRRVEERLG